MTVIWILFKNVWHYISVEQCVCRAWRHELAHSFLRQNVCHPMRSNISSSLG
uniref:Uncharacterized protein n=1 Tax=Anguilla anguilla TaxID=7936 RepID=A0A0E9THJ2_ANGAN